MSSAVRSCSSVRARRSRTGMEVGRADSHVSLRSSMLAAPQFHQYDSRTPNVLLPHTVSGAMLCLTSELMLTFGHARPPMLTLHR